MQGMEVGLELPGKGRFGLECGLVIAEAESVRYTKDVGVDSHEVGLGELYHDDIGGLLADTCQLDELLGIERDLTVELLDELLCHLDDVLGLVVEERAAVDDLLDIIELCVGKRDGVRVLLKKRRGQKVDPFVRTLGREGDGDHQLKGVTVGQFGHCFVIPLYKGSFDRFDLFLGRFFHSDTLFYF